MCAEFLQEKFKGFSCFYYQKTFPHILVESEFASKTFLDYVLISKKFIFLTLEKFPRKRDLELL
jgi:hypothetical protein